MYLRHMHSPRRIIIYLKILLTEVATLMTLKSSDINCSKKISEKQPFVIINAMHHYSAWVQISLVHLFSNYQVCLTIQLFLHVFLCGLGFFTSKPSLTYMFIFLWFIISGVEYQGENIKS